MCVGSSIEGAASFVDRDLSKNRSERGLKQAAYRTGFVGLLSLIDTSIDMDFDCIVIEPFASSR